MSMSDIIADALTRIRNAQNAGHESVDVHENGLIRQIVKIMKDEGYIADYIPFQDKAKKMVKVELKYYQNKPVIRGIDRVSKPGRRQYQGSPEIKPARNNHGINIYSTSKGVMTGKQARLQNVGGEYICRIW